MILASTGEAVKGGALELTGQIGEIQVLGGILSQKNKESEGEHTEFQVGKNIFLNHL